jgi:hypothetical protein
MKRVYFAAFLFLAIVFIASGVQANMTIPNSFTSGTPAIAAEVNDNFDAVATAMPGVAQQTFNGFALFSSAVLETVISRAITAPTAGYVLAMASGMLYTNHINGTDSEGYLGISLNSTTTMGNTMDSYIRIPSATATGFWYMPFSVQGVFTVTQGTNTFRILGRNTAANAVGWWDPKLSLLFVPNTYGTITPLATSVIPLDQSGSDTPGY